MKKFSIMASLAIAAGVALTLMGGVGASAHHGDITVEAKCELTGEYKLVHTLQWGNVPEGVTGAVQYRFSSGPWQYAPDIGSPSGSMVFVKTVPGDSTTGPWIEALVEWSNGYQGATHHMTRAEGLAGDCAPMAPEPEDKPYSNAGEEFTCEAWVYWVERGFYAKTFYPSLNEWKFDTEPTIVEVERTEHPTTDAEKRARGCYMPPTLAETGFDGVEWWHVGLGALLLSVGVGAIIVAERRKGNW